MAAATSLVQASRRAVQRAVGGEEAGARARLAAAMTPWKRRHRAAARSASGAWLEWEGGGEEEEEEAEEAHPASGAASEPATPAHGSPRASGSSAPPLAAAAAAVARRSPTRFGGLGFRRAASEARLSTLADEEAAGDPGEPCSIVRVLRRHARVRCSCQRRGA